MGMGIGLGLGLGVGVRVGVRVWLRLGWGVGRSVPVATSHSIHSTCIKLQLSLATTSSLLDLYYSGAINRHKKQLRLGGGGGESVPAA